MDTKCFSEADKKNFMKNSIKIILNMAPKDTNMSKDDILEDVFQPRQELQGHSKFECRMKDDDKFKEAIEHEDNSLEKNFSCLITELSDGTKQSKIVQELKKQDMVRQYKQIIRDFFYSTPFHKCLEED